MNCTDLTFWGGVASLMLGLAGCFALALTVYAGRQLSRLARAQRLFADQEEATGRALREELEAVTRLAQLVHDAESAARRIA